MGAIRTLYTDLKLRSADALKGLVAYGRQWQTIEKVVANATTAIERNADRAAAAMARMAESAASVRAASAGGSGGGFGGGGGGGRGARAADPHREAARQAREQAAANARERAQAQREAAESARVQRDLERAADRQRKEAARRARARPAADPLDAIMAESRKSAAASETAAGRQGARMGGLADGAQAVTTATAALGPFATKAERARAAVSDLSEQVARNRREMADLKAQAARTGDQNGHLRARMQGLSAETLRASTALSKARAELRSIDGGFLKAVKSATLAKVSVTALGTAFGNLLTGAVSGALRGVTGLLGESAKQAMSFEKALVDVEKVAQDADLKGGVLDPKIAEGIKQVSKDLGVMPTEVAELTAAITAGFSGKTDIVALASDVTKIGVAWDISGKQAGEFFKATSAGLQLNADETKLLFGSVNELGNQLGVKSADIAEGLTRSAGVLKGANLSGETGAALIATLEKAGASAEVAATGVRTFVARLGAGEAATEKQLKAFEALGLSAESVAKNLASGDAKRAEGQIKEVVAALVKMRDTNPEQSIATLIELFGSESIGSIGAAATATESLAVAFGIAGDKAAAATSVQKEYDRVSRTSASGVEKLKANVAVLAIELGNALLPHINELTAFLTSPEGLEWGKSAVEGAVGAVTTLAGAIKTTIAVVQSLVSSLGGTAVAVGAIGIAAAALTGPFGLAAAAGLAIGASIAQGMMAARDAILGTQGAIDGLVRDMRTKVGLATQAAEVEAEAAGGAAQHEVSAKVRDLEARYRKQLVGQGVSDAEATRRAAKLSLAVAGENRSLGGGTAAERAAEWERRVLAGEMSTGAPSTVGPDPAAEAARFAELSKRIRAGEKLKPSEAKEYGRLSKSLDLAKATKGRTHKQTKMDKQLAAMGADVRGVLTAGGERDAGGDLKVHDDALSRAVYDRARGGRGGTDRSDGAGIGPGPNITNWNINTQVALAIDARSTGGVPDNIRSAGMQVANQSGVVFTGVAKMLGQRNAGGVMRGPV